MSFEKVKLTQLRALAAIAETANFSEAALSLGLSQSTISHSIAALESELGVVLLTRGRHGAVLTPVGETVCAKVRALLQLVDEIGQAATVARGVDGGVVRLVAFRSMASTVLPRAIAHLHQRYPSINITITELDTLEQLQQALLEGQADVCMAELLPADYGDLPNSHRLYNCWHGLPRFRNCDYAPPCRRASACWCSCG